MAYASLVSLAQLLDQIFCDLQNRSLYDEQQIESLREKVGFLQESIEDCDQRRIKITRGLETQMKTMAHLAEDIIETKLVDHIIRKSRGRSRGSTPFCEKIEELIHEFDSIKGMVTRMKERGGVKDDQCSRKSFGASSSGVVRPGGKMSAVVGLEDHLVRVMAELTVQRPKRQIFPIVGMGGIGKTTLCRNVFENPLIVQHFHVRAWVTVSQEYSVRELIQRLLREIREPFEREYRENTQSFEEMRDDQLGEELHKGLSGRTYLIVMDDVWSVQVWDEVMMYLPDNGNGSRIMVTTRLLDVAHRLGSCSPYMMNFLGEDESWSLLCQTVFGQESYPMELEDTGKQIARNCKGLPLAIVVIGGLLSKSDMTREYWEYVAQNLSSIVNTENEEHCLKVLSLSYIQLPVHLKPCFLYLGTFLGDGEIRVSKLIRLWVAEGFLKPIVDKSLEEVAEEYLNDLIDRNLILVGTRKSNAKVKSCSIHDLLRDLCIKEAHKENLFRLVTGAEPGIHFLGNQRDFEEWHSLSSMKDARRLVIPKHRFENNIQIRIRANSASFTRSLFSESDDLTKDLISSFRLLRIVDNLSCNAFGETVGALVNSRYLAFRDRASDLHHDFYIPRIMAKLRNLQTLVVSSKSNKPVHLPWDILRLPHLRHIDIEEDAFLQTYTMFKDLNNLQTLSTIRNFSCEDENFLGRIPNLKKLKISVKRHEDYHLNKLVLLQKLESLSCRGFGKIFLGDQAFPDSLKKLTLNWLKLSWKDVSIIGSLPNLQVLKLRGAVYGKEWNTVDGAFLKLKYLLLESLDLFHWEAESSHFPRLESLIIGYCQRLRSIPSGIGEIPTLKLIELYDCSEFVNSSAQHIEEEQRDLGNEDLQVRVKVTSNTLNKGWWSVLPG